MERLALPISIISLMAGGLLYLGFRPSTLLMFIWLEHAGVAPVIYDFRSLVLPYASQVPGWVIFSAPNGLWVLSFAGLMQFIWGRSMQSMAIIWTLLLCLLGVASEVLQAYQIVPGVFDTNDLTSYMMGLLGAFIFLKGR